MKWNNISFSPFYLLFTFAFLLFTFAFTMEVIYEDNHIIAVNKACGEIVMIDQTGDAPLDRKSVV